MKRNPQIPEKESRTLTSQEIREAIPKIEKRINELKSFDFSSLKERYDPRISALEKKIDDTLVSIFGHNTIEYKRFRIPNLDEAPLVIGGIPFREALEGIQKGFSSAIIQLESLIELSKEKLEEVGESPQIKIKNQFADAHLHIEIKKGVGSLFQNGHYSNSIEDACKILEAFVKMRSGKFELSGTELMQNVFSPKNPILKFNDLKNDSDISEQQGMMFLYSGAMLALRNPRAHGIIEDEAESALDILILLSFLLNALDKTKK